MKKPAKKKFKFSPSESYAKFFKDFMVWCESKKINPLKPDLGVIGRYLRYLSNENRKVATLKIKLTAIKRHYELNHLIDKVDFSKFNNAYFSKFSH